MALTRKRAWDKVSIPTSSGVVEAIAPIIISASRATDIPAFYGDWLLNRLQAGYVKWINPFNRRACQFVSLAKARAYVFWTKNPAPFWPVLADLDRRGLGYYFQFTLNDYEFEQWEQGLPPLVARIDTFKRLSERIGPERVIWRFDPLLLTDKTDEYRLVDKISRLGEALHPYTRKLVISIADIAEYRHVQRRITSLGIDWRPFSTDSLTILGRELSCFSKEWGIEIATCSEQADLAGFDIGHNACIDGQLLAKLYPYDEELVQFLGLSVREVSLFTELSVVKNDLKDSGQRHGCRCIMSKDIGSYSTCGHDCCYCYANHSRSLVEANIKHHNPLAEALSE